MRLRLVTSYCSEAESDCMSRAWIQRWINDDESLIERVKDFDKIGNSWRDVTVGVKGAARAGESHSTGSCERVSHKSPRTSS